MKVAFHVILKLFFLFVTFTTIRFIQSRIICCISVNLCRILTGIKHINNKYLLLQYFINYFIISSEKISVTFI